jgi:hypothetical protein
MAFLGDTFCCLGNTESEVVNFFFRFSRFAVCQIYPKAFTTITGVAVNEEDR